MGKFVVQGGRRLEGALRINGSKNAALPIMAASLLATEPVTLYGIPDLRDVNMMVKVLKTLGARVERDGSTMFIDSRDVNNYVVPAELMQEMRASIFVMGPLLARLGKAEAIQPGGCAIGDRPIDLHLHGFLALGAEVLEENGCTLVTAERLHGSEVHLAFPSVGATENIMMAAVRAEGEVRIRNAAMEPEIVDLAQFLEKLGAVVRGAGTPDIRIIGRRQIKGTSHTIIPDRIEAATLALSVAAAGGQVRLENCLVDHLPGFWGRLKDLGVAVEEIDAETVEISSPEKFRTVPVSIHTGPYPGFATDIQPQFMAFLLKVPGVHLISERVFENRLGHARELRRMGGQIVADQRIALIYGGRELTGRPVRAYDLRAGAALIVAALQAQGTTVIEGREIIERGYENIAYRLQSLGANIYAQ